MAATGWERKSSLNKYLTKKNKKGKIDVTFMANRGQKIPIGFWAGEYIAWYIHKWSGNGDGWGGGWSLLKLLFRKIKTQ